MFFDPSALIYLYPDPRWLSPQHERREAASGAQTAADRRDVSTTPDWLLDRVLDQMLDRLLEWLCCYNHWRLFLTRTEDRDQMGVIKPPRSQIMLGS